MTTPFEDLEYLADYLPDEGEAVIVARRGGELICEPLRQDSPQERALDAELYGRLVQANERLKSVGAPALWGTALMLIFGACLALHKSADVAWEGWYFDVGILLAGGAVCYGWIQLRQRRLFREQIRPMLDAQLRCRGINRYGLMGVARQHAEL